MVNMHMMQGLWFHGVGNLDQATNDYGYDLGRLAQLCKSVIGPTCQLVSAGTTYRTEKHSIIRRLEQ